MKLLQILLLATLPSGVKGQKQPKADNKKDSPLNLGRFGNSRFLKI
jgi:hypothetical protein